MSPEASAATSPPNGATQTSAPPNSPTSNSPTSNSAPPSIRATLVVASPANASSRPGQLDRPRDRTRGDTDQKDGKK